MRSLQRFVYASLFLLMASSTVLAAYFDGFFALDTGDYDTAYTEWRSAASGGDAPSMTGLGGLYEDGLGIAKDDVMAFVYYELATALGDNEAASKRSFVRLRLSPTELDEADTIISEVKSTGRLPAKVRVSNVNPSVPTKAFVSEEVPVEPVVETQAQPSVEQSEPGVEFTEVCKFSQSWQDRGSGGARDVGLHEPKAPNGVWVLGSHGQNNYQPASGCVTALKPLNRELVKSPKSWQLIWWDKGSGAEMDGSLWRALPPSNDYVCLGSVSTKGYKAPKIKRYGCVHRCMVVKSRLGKSLWDDRGTNAKKPVSIHRLPYSSVIVAFAGRNAPQTADDLDKTALCVTGQ